MSCGLFLKLVYSSTEVLTMDNTHLSRGCYEAVRLELICPALEIIEDGDGASEAVYDAITSDSGCSVCPCACYQ